jgi:hypothetical protein
MVNNRGSLLDTTSALTSDGRGFTVTYGSTGAAQVGGGSGRGGRLQPGTAQASPLSFAPPTGQSSATVFFGVVPTDGRKTESHGS